VYYVKYVCRKGFFQVAKPLKVVFLGSGPIAVPIMQTLAASPEIELQAIISQIDRPAGRKRIMTPTPLAAAALEMGLEVIRTQDVNQPEFVEFLQQLSPDMLCVVSFGQILKTPVLSVPSVCCVNVHASLLPQYRGASPITQALLNNDPATGVCFMQMERGLDSGPVFRIIPLPLNGDEYANTLEDTLGELAAEYAVETLQGIVDGKFPPQPQDPALVSVCRKISKRDGIIDWKMPAARIEAMTRAFSRGPELPPNAPIPTVKKSIFPSVPPGFPIPPVCCPANVPIFPARSSSDAEIHPLWRSGN
jgi:methionyl-tRNA formyltransferase